MMEYERSTWSIAQWSHNSRARHVMDDWSKAKPREECEPFSFTLATEGRWGPDVKGQERFVKGLAKLTAQQARAQAKRDRAAAKATKAA